MKKKIAYIDHSFHKKTLSSLFLMNIFEKDFDIVNLWDDSWNGGPGISADQINRIDCDYVLFFQILPPMVELKQIKHKIIWVPMYDSCLLYGRSFWIELTTLPIKIISFSKTLSMKMTKAGLTVLDIKFSFNPSDFNEKLPKKDESLGVSVFFWQRGPITFNKVKRVLGDLRIKQIVIKNDPDPGYEPLELSEGDVTKYNIKTVTGHLSKEAYLELVENCDLFFAPRNFEGIGMSFLEPMSMGKVVVAPNYPTMNEYIEDGKNGFLYSNFLAKRQNISGLRVIGEKSREDMQAYYKKWIYDTSKIYLFIGGRWKKKDINSFVLFIIRVVDAPILLMNKIYFKLVNFL